MAASMVSLRSFSLRLRMANATRLRLLSSSKSANIAERALIKVTSRTHQPIYVRSQLNVCDGDHVQSFLQNNSNSDAAGLRHSSSAASNSDCWKCGEQLKNKKQDPYFCVCGIVQAPDPSLNHFEIMGVEETYDIDVKQLTEKYRQLQKFLHPDKFSQKTEREREYSSVHSAQVNKAYLSLSRPLSRGLYILRLKEEELEKEIEMSQQFLGEIMEFNEEVVEADSRESLKGLEGENEGRIKELEREISVAFKGGDTVKAKQLLFKVKYYTNIEDKIKDKLQEYTDDIIT